MPGCNFFSSLTLQSAGEAPHFQIELAVFRFKDSEGVLFVLATPVALLRLSALARTTWSVKIGTAAN